MKYLVSIILLSCLLGLVGCASVFHDPLESAYNRGELSREEYEKLSHQQEDKLARSSPAYWERQQTAAQIHYELNPPK